MTKNNLLQIRLSDQELADLDFIVANHPFLIVRNRSEYIVAGIKRDKHKISESKAQQQIDLRKRYEKHKDDTLSREENI